MLSTATLATSRHAPPSWASLPLRACQVCMHGDDLGGQRVCTAPAVVSPARHQPVELMRRPHGPCGPDAEHLDFPGLRA